MLAAPTAANRASRRPPPSAQDAAQVGQRRGRDVDPRVGVVGPVHRYLVDAQPGPLGQHQQLGVEEPAAVLGARQQLAGLVRADRLEAALGVGESRAERRLQQQVVAAGDAVRGAARAPPGTRGPAGCRWRRRCARTAAARRGGAARSGRWTSRRPCRPARRSRWPTRSTAGPARGRAAASRDGADPGQFRGQGSGDVPGGVGAAVVSDRDVPVNGKRAARYACSRRTLGARSASSSLTGTTISTCGPPGGPAAAGPGPAREL